MTWGRGYASSGDGDTVSTPQLAASMSSFLYVTAANVGPCNMAQTPRPMWPKTNSEESKLKCVHDGNYLGSGGGCIGVMAGGRSLAKSEEWVWGLKNGSGIKRCSSKAMSLYSTSSIHRISCMPQPAQVQTEWLFRRCAVPMGAAVLATAPNTFVFSLLRSET